MTIDQLAPRIVRCKYLVNGDRCTAEAVDAVGEILLCTHHLGRALEMLRRRMAAAA